MTELPKGKHIFGIVKVGERGQIVIPKEAREQYSIVPGDRLMVVGGGGKGIAIVKVDFMKKMALHILDNIESAENEPDDEVD